MRNYAENVAMVIRETTDLEANVATKVLADGSEIYGVAVKEKDANIAPTIYVKEMSEHGLTPDEASKEVLKLYEEHKAPNVDVSWFTDFENVKEKLFVKLMPGTFPAEVSRSAGEYGFDDLIIVPYVDVDLGGEGIRGAIKITANHMEKWGVTKRSLMDAAIANTKKQNAVIESLGGFVSQMWDLGCDLPDDLNGPLIVSNKEKVYGASAILGGMKQLKERFAEGFYVIPSSVHEVLVMPKSFPNGGEDALNQMVREVNATGVLPEEVLSNHVYSF